MVNTSRLEELFAIPDKVALVVGAGRGIGRAVATLFADAGAKVVAADVSGENAEAVAQSITEAGGQARGTQVDVRDEASVRGLGEFVTGQFGRLDILVNTAAIFELSKFVDTPVEMWDRTYQVNLRGVFLTMQMAVRLMRESGGGSIVNFSSVASTTPGLLDQAHYDAEKAGVSALTRAAAAEFAADGIRVNGVVPGAVGTEGAASYADWQTRGPLAGLDRIPLGRYGEPQEVAAAALFLVSPAASLITGHEIVADGGFLVS